MSVDTHTGTYFEATKLIFFCISWYTSGALGNIIAKTVLSEFPYPITLSMTYLLSACVYLGPILAWLKVPETPHIPRSFYMKMILPLAAGKCLTSLMTNTSIWKVPISYTHTVKASMPLFTVILSRVIMGEKQTLKVYLSLLPIIGGVVIATLTELSFDIIGLGSALAATTGFALQNIFSKICLKDIQIHHLRLLFIMSKIATACFIPFWLVLDVRILIADDLFLKSGQVGRISLLLFLDGVFNLLQNVFAFSVLAMITPLSYAVANATKRIIIVVTSLLMLRNPVTSVNIFGMSTAIFGVLLYNKVKLDQNIAEKRSSVLPVVATELHLEMKAKNSSLLLNGSVGDWSSPSLYLPNGVQSHVPGISSPSSYSSNSHSSQRVDSGEFSQASTQATNRIMQGIGASPKHAKSPVFYI